MNQLKNITRSTGRRTLIGANILLTAGIGWLACAQTTPAVAQAPVQEYRVGNLIENGFLGEPKGWNLSNFGVDKGSWIHRKEQPGGVGTASTPFLGPDGFYKIRVHYFDEGDGVSRAAVAVGGRPVGSWVFDGILVDTYRWKEFDGVEIKKGEQIVLTGTAGGYEYCRIVGVEILPSEPKEAATAEAAVVESKEYSMNLVSVRDQQGVTKGPEYLLSSEPYMMGGGTHWLYLKAGQRFRLTARPPFAGAATPLRYTLTKVGVSEPADSRTSAEQTTQPIRVSLRAAEEGLYELKLGAGVMVDYDVPGVTSLPANRGYIFVPKGTKAFSVKSDGRTVFLDASEKVMIDELFDNATTRVIPVPAGSDGQIWFFQGTVTAFTGIPPHVALRRDAMLAPAEVLK